VAGDHVSGVLLVGDVAVRSRHWQAGIERSGLIEGKRADVETGFDLTEVGSDRRVSAIPVVPVEPRVGRRVVSNSGQLSGQLLAHSLPQVLIAVDEVGYCSEIRNGDDLEKWGGMAKTAIKITHR
jgi:hypothetical protein